MSPVLEPGYIAKIFDESIYLIGVPKEENTPTEIPLETPEIKPEAVLKPLPKVSLKTKKKLLVLVDKKPTDEENVFISKLIAAVMLTTNDVAILTFADFNKEQYEFEYLLQFGNSSNEKYKIHKEAGYSMLIADELKSLINSLEFKKLLWSSLQGMFNIKK